MIEKANDHVSSKPETEIFHEGEQVLQIMQTKYFESIPVQFDVLSICQVFS